MGERPDYSPSAFAERRRGVLRSAEFDRIWELPKRVLEGSIDPAALTAYLKLPQGHMALKPSQAYALKEIHDLRGAVVGIVPGGGKTLVGALGATLVGAKNPAYLCPAATRSQVEGEIGFYRSQWKVSDVFTVVSYQEISTPNGVKRLEEGNFDYLFCDEAQMLKSLDSARTKRFLRFLSTKKDCVVVVASGSFECREPTECAHLWWPALKDRTPFPTDRDELRTWANAIGSAVKEDMRYSPGVLAAYGEHWLDDDEKAVAGDDMLERTRRGFGKRVAQTPGIVYSTEAATNVVIHMRRAQITVPDRVRAAVGALRATWENELGDEITDNFAFAEAVGQTVCGFYQRRIWPDNKPILEWIDPRRAWGRFVRKIVFERPDLQMDSMKPVMTACQKYEGFREAERLGDVEAVERLRHRPMLDSQQWRDWVAAKPLYDEKREIRWVSEYLVDHAERWLSGPMGKVPGIVWVGKRALGHACAARGMRYFGGGANDIIDYRGPCVASIKAHGVGKNLQWSGASLVLNPMTTGTDWEQLIARQDRMGQERPDIHVEVAQLCAEQRDGFQQAMRDAGYQNSMGRPQRLLRAIGRVEVDFASEMADAPTLWVK